MSNSEKQESEKQAEALERVHLGTRIECQYGLKNSDGDVVETFFVQATTPRSTVEHWAQLKGMLDKEADKKQAELEAQLKDGNS